MKRATSEQQAQSLLCSVEGCTEKWASDYGRRLCSEHLRNDAPKTVPLPLTPPVHPFAEPVERDDGVDF
jgi:hypothetical protein